MGVNSCRVRVNNGRSCRSDAYIAKFSTEAPETLVNGDASSEKKESTNDLFSDDLLTFNKNLQSIKAIVRTIQPLKCVERFINWPR